MTTYLSCVDIKNFQSLENTCLEFYPGFNVIVGPSNLGKSAALRALKALMHNAPAPGLIREGAKQFELTACFSDGTRVQLIKGKNKSVFAVNEAEFPKSGVKAPDEVTQLWAMASVDGRDIGFAGQHNSPFLLDEPASAAAKVFGDLTNANALMEAVQKANRLRTEAMNDAKARYREAEEARDEIDKHVGLRTREAALQLARERLSAFKDLSQTVSSLQGLFSEKQTLETELASLDTVRYALNVDEELESILRTAQTLDSLSKLIASHKNLTAKISEALTEEKQWADLVDTLDEQTHELIQSLDVCPLCEREIN